MDKDYTTKYHQPNDHIESRDRACAFSLCIIGETNQNTNIRLWAEGATYQRNFIYRLMLHGATKAGNDTSWSIVFGADQYELWSKPSHQTIQIRVASSYEEIKLSDPIAVTKSQQKSSAVLGVHDFDQLMALLTMNDALQTFLICSGGYL